MSEELFGQLFFTSVPMIQWQGITVMMAEKPQFVGWNLGILGFYILFFSGLTYVAIRKKNHFYKRREEMMTGLFISELERTFKRKKQRLYWPCT